MLNFSSTKRDDGPSRIYRRVLSILLMALLIAIFASGYRYYTSHQDAAEREARAHIKAIGDLKAGELASWLKERKGDAETIFDSPVSDSLRAFLSDPAAPASRREAVRWLGSLIRHYGYSTAILLDPKGKIVLSSSSADETPAALGIQTRKFIERAFHTRQVVFSDLYREGTPRLDFVVPLLPRKGGDELPIGALLLRVNPHDFLFPLIQTWPTPSATAETLLVRHEGDDIAYLNALRHQDHAPLTLRLPRISMPELPSVQGVRGEGEEVDGIDYRGVAVLAAVRSISNSPWIMVAKVDREEIEAPINRSAIRTGVIVLLLMLVAGLAVWLIWRRQTEAVLRDSQCTLESQVEERTRELEREIEERKNYELRLYYQANHDSLTGLPNRTLLYDRLDHALVHARRNNHSVAVMVLDIDRFKTINDSLGHTAGDALLQALAGRLKDSVREGDTVARLSGDEFIIVVEDLPREEAVHRVASKVLQAMDDPFKVDDYELFITCRLGISLFPRDGEGGQVLLKNADAALQYIKKQPYSRIQFYTRNRLGPSPSLKAGERRINKLRALWRESARGA